MTEVESAPVKTVACIGVGLIGGGWAIHFLRAGLDVWAYDPDPNRESYLRQTVDEAWSRIEALGLSAEASKSKLHFTTDLAEALKNADFVQESAVEDEGAKIALLAQLDAALDPSVIIASSSSGFLAARLRSDCKAGGRVIIGHPFNPPFLIPLVEVVGGEGVGEGVVDRATAFYESLGSKVVVLQSEIKGYIANRIQSAVFREVLYLLSENVGSLADIDDAVTHGPAIRWACLGPSSVFCLGARSPELSPEFIDLLVHELGDGYASPPEFKPTPDLIARYVSEMTSAYGVTGRDRLKQRRDAGVLGVRAALQHLEPVGKPESDAE